MVFFCLFRCSLCWHRRMRGASTDQACPRSAGWERWLSSYGAKNISFILFHGSHWLIPVLHSIFTLKAFPFFHRCLTSHQTARAKLPLKFTFPKTIRLNYGLHSCLSLSLFSANCHDYNDQCHDSFMGKVNRPSYSKIAIMIVMTIVKMHCLCT